MAVNVESATNIGSAIVPPPNRSPRSRQLSLSSSPSVAAPGSTRRGSTPSGRSSLFSFPWGRPANVKRQTSTELQQAHAAAAATAAASTSPSTAAAAAAPPRRRWFRYPVRVPILSLLLVSLLARTSEGWTSICGFLCGFLLFEGFSAPETGHPNRFDTLMRKCTNSIRACRKRRRKRAAGSLARRRMSAQGGLGTVAAHATQESFRKRIIGRLSSWIRSPFRACLACCRRRSKKHAGAHAVRNSNTDSDDPASARPLLSENESAADFPRSSPDDSAATAATIAAAVAEEEESDVLLDVALSVTEDLEAPPASAANSAGDSSAAGAAAASQSPAGADAPITPLHPLTDLTDSPLLLPSLPSLPTVSSLEPADLEDDPPSVSAPGSGSAEHASTNLGVTGGVVNFAHVSVSLRFTFRAYHIHLHHWLYLLIILLFLYMEQVGARAGGDEDAKRAESGACIVQEGSAQVILRCVLCVRRYGGKSTQRPRRSTRSSQLSVLAARYKDSNTQTGIGSCGGRCMTRCMLEQTGLQAQAQDRRRPQQLLLPSQLPRTPWIQLPAPVALLPRQSRCSLAVPLRARTVACTVRAHRA